MTKAIKMNHHAETSALIYYDAIVEACKKARVTDPLRALTETDEFPRLMKMSGVEFAIGWLHGCAESHAVTIEALWKQLTPRFAAASEPCGDCGRAIAFSDGRYHHLTDPERGCFLIRSERARAPRA